MAKHFGSDDEGVGLGITESRRIHLTVAHRPVFRLYCNEAYQYAYRGTVHHYLMEVERLNGFEGPIVLQAGDRQNRDLDGVQIQQIIVDPGQTQVGVPVHFEVGQNKVHVNVRFSANARVRPQSSLRLRGHGVLYEDIPVISETSIPITKVAEQ